MSESEAFVSPGPLVRDLQGLGAAAGAVQRELESLPWYGLLRSAVRGAKRGRLHFFLRSVESAEAQLDEAQRERFCRATADPESQELLTDFAETVVRTSSRIAIAALGILYADQGATAFPPAFRRLACEALDGMSDDLVEAYLAIHAAALRMAGQGYPGTRGVHRMQGGSIDDSGPYPVFFLQHDWLEKTEGLHAQPTIAAVQHLLSRGIFLPDFSPRVGGHPSVMVGIGDDTERFYQLLTKARAWISEQRTREPDSTE